MYILRSQLHALREIHFVTMSESDFVPPDKGLSDVLSLSSDTECTSVAIVESLRKSKGARSTKNERMHLLMGVNKDLRKY